eukprot:1395969-Prymnesium_polylepis.1
MHVALTFRVSPQSSVEHSARLSLSARRFLSTDNTQVHLVNRRHTKVHRTPLSAHRSPDVRRSQRLVC